MGLKILNRRARQKELVEADDLTDLVGCVTLWPGSSASIPAGWLECDGGYVDSAVYPELFAKLGTTWGPLAIGVITEFKKPDFRGRSAFGVGTHGDVAAVPFADAALLANRRPGHTHVAGPSTHQHSALHSHTSDSHTHPSGGAHSHTSTPHSHAVGNHTHPSQGITGVPNVGATADANQSETDTRNMAHNHSAGSLTGDANNFGGGTGNDANRVNGGFTNTASPGPTGAGQPAAHPSSGGEVTDPQVTGAAQAAGVPFLVMRWIVRATP